MQGISLGSSQRAADLLLKARILRARRGSRPEPGAVHRDAVVEHDRGDLRVADLRATRTLADAGIEHFDAWAAVFVDYATTVEVSPDASGIRLVQRPARIRNLPELRRMLASCSDVLRPEELGLQRPQRHEQTVVCEPGPAQLEYVGSLGARVDKLHREKVRGEPGGDNMLTVCGDGRRVALDPVLVGVARAIGQARRDRRPRRTRSITSTPSTASPAAMPAASCR